MAETLIPTPQEELAQRQAEFAARNAAFRVPPPVASTPIAQQAMPIGANNGSSTPQQVPTAASAMPGANVPPAAGAPDRFLSDLYKGRIEKEEEKQKNPWGSANNHPGVLGKLGHGLAEAGNIAGDILVPKIMARVPGTALNRKIGEAENEKGYETARAGEDKSVLDAAEAAKARLPIPAKGIGGPQIGENGNFWIAQEPAGGGAPVMTDTGVKAHPNTGTYESEDPNNPGHTIREAFNKNNVAAGPTAMGPGKAEAPKNLRVQSYIGKDGLQHHDSLNADGSVAQHDVVPPSPAGTYQPTLGPNGETTGFYNTKNPQQTQSVAPAPAQPAAVPGAPPAAPQYTGMGARVHMQNQMQFQSQIEKPALDMEQNYQKATVAVDAYNRDPKTGAAGMVLFAQHLGTTLGSVKGAAVGEGAQEAHANAIGLEDRAKRYEDYLATGQPLSASQVKDFYSLIGETRQISWQITAHTAQQRGMDINLPADVKIKVTAPDGSVKEVNGDKVKYFVDKGGKVGF